MLSGEDMDVAVRVMSGNQEIERITCHVQMENGSPVATYQQRLWRVVDGCIHIDDACHVGLENELAWPLLVHNLLPSRLPDQVDACSELLQACFREALLPGVIQAAASLAALRLEQQARALLVDVLKEHRDAARLHCLLQAKPLFREGLEKAEESHSLAVTTENGQTLEPEPFQPVDLDWEWAAAAEELEAPDVDDSALRAVAGGLQESIGVYSAKETGARFIELEELADSTLLLDVARRTSDHHQKEAMLLKRVARLGSVALDLLRYFADNPGDKALHAESILGYSVSEINRLLLGSLGHYLKKSSSGGWECQPWVIDMLSVLDDSRDGR